MSTHKKCTQNRGTVLRLYDGGSSGSRICRDERKTSSEPVPVRSIGNLHNVMGKGSEEEMFTPNYGRSFSYHGACSRVEIGGCIEGNCFRLRVRSLNDMQIHNHSHYVQEVDSSPYIKEFENSLFQEDEVLKFSPIFHIEIGSPMEKTCDSSNSLNLQFTLSREQDESINYFILQQETGSKEWKDITNECSSMEGSQAGIEIPVKQTSKVWVIHLKQSLSSLKNSLLALVHGRVLFHVLLYYQYLKIGRKIKLRIVGINEEMYQNPKQLRTAITIAEEDGFLKLEEKSPKQILRKGYLLSYYKNNECTKDLGKFGLGKKEVKKKGDWLTHSFDVNELNNNLKVDVTDKDGNIQWSFDLNEIFCDKVISPENCQDLTDSTPGVKKMIRSSTNLSQEEDDSDNWDNFSLSEKMFGNDSLTSTEYKELVKRKEQVLKATNAFGDPSRILAMNIELGYANFRFGDYTKAVEYYLNSFELSTAAEIQSGILCSLGDVYLYLEEFEKAIEYYQKSLEIAASIGNENVFEMADSNALLGHAYIRAQQFENAIKCYENGLKISTSNDYLFGQAKIYSNLGNAYRCVREYYKAIYYYEISLELSTEIDYWSNVSTTNINLGNVYFELNDYEKAMCYHQQALENCRESCDHTGIAACFDSLATIYFIKGELDVAVEYYEQALEIRKGKLHSNYAIENYLYHVPPSLDKPEKVQRYHHQAVKIQEEVVSGNMVYFAFSTPSKEAFEYSIWYRVLHHGLTNPDLNEAIKARSLALRFCSLNPSCVRAIPCKNQSDVPGAKSIVMYLYVDADGEGIIDHLQQAAEEIFSDNYRIEFVDLQRRSLCQTVIRLPKCEKSKGEELKSLSSIIEKKLHVFDNRLNVTAVQASYKVVGSYEKKVPCVTVYVLGKGRIPVGESEMDDSLLDVKLDIVEGYYQPCGNSYKSYQSPLFSGFGIGIKEDECGGAGTIGGFLIDENGKRYLLTCDHVLQPMGIKNLKNIIVQPAERDFKEELALASSDVTYLHDKVRKQKSMLTAEDSRVRQRCEYDLKKTQKELEEKEKDKENLLDAPPRSIGHYVCGLIVNEQVEINDNNHVPIYVDAGIAELSEDELTGIEMEKEYEIEDDCCPLYGFKNEKKVGFVPTGQIVDLKEFRKTDANGLMKIGRSTGLTEDGQLEDTNIFVNRFAYGKDVCAGNLCHVPYKFYCKSCEVVTNENQVDLSCMGKTFCAKCDKTIECGTKDSSASWAFNCMVIKGRKKPFCEKGDSGALVFDKRGRAWGMVFGVFNADGINIDYGLASPLSVTLQVLERISKKKQLTLWVKSGQSDKASCALKSGVTDRPNGQLTDAPANVPVNGSTDEAINAPDDDMTDETTYAIDNCTTFEGTADQLVER